MKVTKWIGRYGFQIGAIDGVQHTSSKIDGDGIARSRRSVILIGKAESNYHKKCKMYIFFCFRIIIDE